MNWWKGLLDWLLFLGIAALIVVAWLFGWTWIDANVKSTDPHVGVEIARGVFGDKFGAISSLFTSLAFAGVIFTIMLQRRDLAMQNKSIRAQAEIMALQSFETGFFNLLDQHKSNIEQLRVSGNEGKAVFSFFNEKMVLEHEQFPVFQVLKKIPKEKAIALKSATTVPPDINALLQLDDQRDLADFVANRKSAIDQYLDEDLEPHHRYIQHAYLGANSRINYALSHYFRTLYVVYRYIDSAIAISEEQKIGYGRIVRALLSDDELVAVFYNCLIRPIEGTEPYEFGFYKMTRFTKKYDILQNLPRTKVIHYLHWKILEKMQIESESLYLASKVVKK